MNNESFEKLYKKLEPRRKSNFYFPRQSWNSPYWLENPTCWQRMKDYLTFHGAEVMTLTIQDIVRCAKNFQILPEKPEPHWKWIMDVSGLLPHIEATELAIKNMSEEEREAWNTFRVKIVQAEACSHHFLADGPMVGLYLAPSTDATSCMSACMSARASVSTDPGKVPPCEEPEVDGMTLSPKEVESRIRRRQDEMFRKMWE